MSKRHHINSGENIMKNIATIIALVLVTIFAGCSDIPTAPKTETVLEMKNVNVQLMYYGKPTQWQATFHIQDMSSNISDRKPMDDTSAYNLGKFHQGSKIRIAYDSSINVRQTDNFLSIRYIIGNDTTTVYGVEGLYTIITVK